MILQYNSNVLRDTNKRKKKKTIRTVIKMKKKKIRRKLNEQTSNREK